MKSFKLAHRDQENPYRPQLDIEPHEGLECIATKKRFTL